MLFQKKHQTGRNSHQYGGQQKHVAHPTRLPGLLQKMLFQKKHQTGRNSHQYGGQQKHVAHPTTLPGSRYSTSISTRRFLSQSVLV